MSRGARRLVDVSHVVEHGMTTYPGLPGPVVCDFMSREASRARYGPGVEFHIGRIDMVANTGTYVDAPFHRWADGADVAGLALESLADLETLVVRVPEGRRAVGDVPFPAADLRGCAVLFHTGWSRHWRTERYVSGHPFLTGDLAARLRDAGAALVGIDSLNIDDTDDPERPVHSTLLRDGVPIVEHLTGLEALPDRGARFFAVPVKVGGLGSFPVRAFGVVSG